MSNNKYKQVAASEARENTGGRRPKKNNRHAYGFGNGKFGKKTDRIKRAEQRAAK